MIKAGIKNANEAAVSLQPTEPTLTFQEQLALSREQNEATGRILLARIAEVDEQIADVQGRREVINIDAAHERLQ